VSHIAIHACLSPMKCKYGSMSLKVALNNTKHMKRLIITLFLFGHFFTDCSAQEFRFGISGLVESKLFGFKKNEAVTLDRVFNENSYAKAVLLNLSLAGCKVRKPKERKHINNQSHTANLQKGKGKYTYSTFPLSRMPYGCLN